MARGADQYGAPGPRAPDTGERRCPPGIYSTHHGPPEAALPESLFCNSSYIHTCARGYVEAAVSHDDVDDLNYGSAFC